MKIGIIGGGAAGLMAAAAALEAHPFAEIFLIDKNDGLGKKVIISGGGRCNVTTGIHDVKTVLTKYPRGGKFLTSAMYAFSPDQIFSWFESHGVPLKTEADSRVFPVSDDGKDIVRVFERIFAHSGVRVMLRSSVEKIEKHAQGYCVYLLHHHEPLIVDRVILTTGGQAYRQTGSTGDGYAFAISLGHTITALAPSLSSLTTQESWPASLSGLSSDAATLTAYTTPKASFTGPFLFTHRGISGPAVFALSSLVAFTSFSPIKPLEVSIDLFPHTASDDLFARIVSCLAEHPRKSVVNAFTGLIPKGLAEVLLTDLGIPHEKHAAELSKQDILRCTSWLKCALLHVVGRGTGDEFVTAGGVSLAEVDPRTMESKISPGLFFAGEILDVDGFTGGFNLTASWATGRMAGSHAALPS